MSGKTLTIDEFLNNDENSRLVVERIVDHFRETGEWGKRGLFRHIAEKTGFTPAYIGRVLTGKQRITSDLLMAIMKAFNLHGITNRVKWPDSYDVYAKILSTYEVLLTAAIEYPEDMFISQFAAGPAKQVLDFTEEAKQHFNQNHLKEVQKMALKVLDEVKKRRLSETDSP
jgi:transcriptional regulator with XRE-family HTH domain